ncbi:Prp18 domain-containing protein [Vararia minispora EC-137]|uniref:Prp18 domain-containing protein n=1 Tax=Vararia minispora EC-137 TaxID=1314806 RepID=A0ACB8QDD4_9AGAM|nr:Prp18 domain-containing protein [Vararia minispora EC-137]
MDILKAELASKRKAQEVASARPNKYMRKGDIEKMREEKELSFDARLTPASASPLPSTSRATSSPPPDVPSERAAFNIPNEEVIRRLRAKSQPIRLFGESDKDRRLRLRALELIEERGHDRAAGQNDFRKALEDVESAEREKKAGAAPAPSAGDGKRKKAEAPEGAGAEIDLALVKTDPDKLYPLIYYALKRVLKEWEQSMAERPEHVKRTTQGKLAAATQVQSAEYLKPLFKLLRSRSLPSDVLARMAEIVHHMQKRQYQKANDSYLRLSIGNAPWPIGVTMVGIHERSAREKISTDQVAHVLNDEVSRKYIQSLKRLLTFSQTKWPPDDVSQLMG